MDLTNKRILITGASGSIGKQLIYELDKRGIKPIAHVRRESDTTYIDSLGLEKRVADLRDQLELAKLVEGIDLVIHTAGWIDFQKGRLTQFTGINTFAAIDLFRAAEEAGVQRFLHLSSIVAVGAIPKRSGNGSEELADETLPFNLGHLAIPYIMTKHAAEAELFKLAREKKTELVMVNPSVIITPTAAGQNRERVKRAFSRWIFPELMNRVNLVDIRDVAPGIIAALENGRAGERYIMAGDNINMRDLALSVSAVLHKIPHLVNFPRPLLNSAARFALFTGTIFGKSRITFYPDIVKLLDYDWAFSSMKARRELGYTNRSIHISVDDFLTNNFIGTWLRPTEE